MSGEASTSNISTATRSNTTLKTKLPRTLPSRLVQSLSDPAYPSTIQISSTEPETSKSTVLYLAYGANLSAETFIGRRGIKPLSAINVHAPSLDLTFDLVGIPYREPCFSNSRFRTPPTSSTISSSIDNTDYHKDRWKKGLVGVVYEVTVADYAKIIATEGGGASYEDVIVPCYAIPEDSKYVDPVPKTTPFKAHTLLCPFQAKSIPVTPTIGGRVQRPDPSYAQASARYLKLITDGAEEHNLPDEYKAYLYDIRPYTITTTRQRIGAPIFLGLWVPPLILLLIISKIVTDGEGKLPEWTAVVMSVFSRLMWGSYDLFFKKVFGDGERTMKRADTKLQ